MPDLERKILLSKRYVALRDATRSHGKAVVKNHDAMGAIAFVMPSAQIPDTLDKKAISDAVLASGKIILGQ